MYTSYLNIILAIKMYISHGISQVPVMKRATFSQLKKKSMHRTTILFPQGIIYAKNLVKIYFKSRWWKLQGNQQCRIPYSCPYMYEEASIISRNAFWCPYVTSRSCQSYLIKDLLGINLNSSKSYAFVRGCRLPHFESARRSFPPFLIEQDKEENEGWQIFSHNSVVTSYQLTETSTFYFHLFT